MGLRQRRVVIGRGPRDAGEAFGIAILVAAHLVGQFGVFQSDVRIVVFQRGETAH